MALETLIRGGVSNDPADVGPDGHLKVMLEPDSFANPNNVGTVRFVSENDSGLITGAPVLFAPETDIDYRLRTSKDVLLDTFAFNHTAQDTGKHYMLASTLAPSFILGAFNTNPTNVLTTAAGVLLRTYTTFPVLGTGTLSFDIIGGFTGAPAANVLIEFGGFLCGAAVATDPVDGVFFRLTSGGLQGIASFNGSETGTGLFPTSSTDPTPWMPELNKKYQWIVYITQRAAQFWMNDGTGAIMLGQIPTPAGRGQPVASTALPFCVRQYHSGAAGSAISFALGGYSVRIGGPDLAGIIGTTPNSYLAAYQGLSGGTLGSLMRGTITSGSVVPLAAAVPTNTTAALGTGLGGTFYETDTLAVNVDGIICSFQVPALPTAVGATYGPQRRLRIDGISLASFVALGLTGGPYCATWYLAFGHTAVSLATAEAATTKAPRRVPLPFVQSVTAAQAIGTPVNQSHEMVYFKNPIYVNPGEFVALVKTKIGTAPSAGTIAHQIMFDYTWE